MRPNGATASTKDNLATMAAIGVLAFIATDVAHEVVGHGIGLLLAGGRAGTLTTTKLVYPAQLPAPLWRIFDLGGPIGNLIWAAICLVLQRLIRGAAPGRRLFLWAGAMFALFWEFGYLMKCGLTGQGDAMALIEGLKPAGVWRAILFVAGLILYRGATRILAADFHFVIRAAERNWQPRARRILWTLYLAGGSPPARVPCSILAARARYCVRVRRAASSRASVLDSCRSPSRSIRTRASRRMILRKVRRSSPARR